METIRPMRDWNRCDDCKYLKKLPETIRPMRDWNRVRAWKPVWDFPRNNKTYEGLKYLSHNPFQSLHHRNNKTYEGLKLLWLTSWSPLMPSETIRPMRDWNYLYGFWFCCHFVETIRPMRDWNEEWNWRAQSHGHRNNKTYEGLK